MWFDVITITITKNNRNMYLYNNNKKILTLLLYSFLNSGRLQKIYLSSVKNLSPKHSSHTFLTLTEKDCLCFIIIDYIQFILFIYHFHKYGCSQLSPKVVLVWFKSLLGANSYPKYAAHTRTVNKKTQKNNKKPKHT